MRNIWADPDTFVKSPKRATNVLRELELPRIDAYIEDIAKAGGIDLSELRTLSANTLVAMKGEEQLAMRRIIAPFFSRESLASWAPMLEQACETAGDMLEASEDADLVRDFTIPLFMLFLPRVLGLMLPQSREAFDDIETTQRLTEPYLSVSVLKAMNRAVVRLVAACPERDDTSSGQNLATLLDVLLKNRSGLPENVAPEYFVVGLLVGSNSALQSLAFALHGLLSGPNDLWPRAHEHGWSRKQSQEILGRYQSTRTLVRVANDDMVVGGCPYHAGQTEVVDIVAVNSALRLESERSDAHMSFGCGTHKCPGAFLSEMLVEAAIPYLARRFPSLTLKAERCQFVVTPMMQAPTSLPCETDAGSKRVSTRLCEVMDLNTARYVLTSPAAFKAPPMAEHLQALDDAGGRDFGPAIQIARNAMFFMEGERHLALRDKIGQLLNPMSLAAWSGLVGQEIEAVLDDIDGASVADIVTDFSDPLRKRIVKPIFGILSADPERFDDLSPEFQDVLEPWLPVRKLERLQAVFAEAQSLMEMPQTDQTLKSVLEQLQRDPPAGFDLEDLKSVMVVLYGASFNLSHTLSNCVCWMLSLPTDARAGISGREWVAENLEDLIGRHASPKFIYRSAQQAQDVGEIAWRTGDTARLNIRVINRQTEGKQGRLSFGLGMHRCVGAALSRLVIREAIPSLFARFPEIASIPHEHSYFDMSQTVALSRLPCVLR